MSFFKNIFGSKNNANPVSLDDIAVDMHSHLIPGIDDGSGTVEESLELVRSLHDMGYKKIITTPHVMGDFYQNTPEIIQAGCEQVRRILKDNHIHVQIDCAAEYMVDDGFMEKLARKELLTFGDNYVLIELPLYNAFENLPTVLFELQTQGYKIVLAHPERYLYWYDNFAKFEELKDRDVIFQLNLMSLTGHYSPQTKKLAEKMIDLNMIELVGTDTHRQSHIDVLQQSLYSSALEKLIDSGKLLNKSLL